MTFVGVESVKAVIIEDGKILEQVSTFKYLCRETLYRNNSDLGEKR
jgi:hypothetical protein